MTDFVNAFTFMGDHVDLLWQKTLDTLALSSAAVGGALLIGLPLRLVLGHLRRGSFVAVNALNILRALPSLAAIAINNATLSAGFLNLMFALVAAAFPVI